MAQRCRCAGRVAATGAVGAVVVGAYGAIPGTELIPAWVMHAVADIPEVEYAAAAVGDDAGRVAVVARWLAFGAVVWIGVVVGKNLGLPQLRCHRVGIADTCACDVGLFLHSVAIQLGFGGFGDFWIDEDGNGVSS